MRLLIINPKPLPESLNATPFPPIDATTPMYHWRDETRMFAVISHVSVPEVIYFVSKFPDYVEIHIGEDKYEENTFLNTSNSFLLR